MMSEIEHPSEKKINEMVELVREKVMGTDFPLAIRTDSQFLAKFIRSKRYNIDKAVTAVHKYYTNLYANMHYVTDIFPAKFVHIYDHNMFRLLKHPFKGARIVHAAINKWDTKKASLRDIECSTSFLLEEIFQADTSFQLNGCIGIADLSGLGFCHVRQATYSEIKLAITIVLQMFPIKVAGIHILNAPAIFWPVYKLAVKLLPQKIQDRIYFHSNLQDLATALAPEILPKSLGGSLEDEEAFDNEFIPRVVELNLPYDWYWNGSMERPYQPRRLTRKRSSMMMCN